MRKISDALSGILRLGFDSDCIIYFVDPNPEFDQRMTAIFREVASGKIAGLTSTLALTEGLVRPCVTGICRPHSVTGICC